jgi:ADP-ribosylglycohydrolase
MPKAPWGYTDDTEMALSVFAMLRDHKLINQDALARAFSERMGRERGYGRSAFEILWSIRQGASWMALSHGAFGGSGSYGNGAAMRVAPLGAYFADDIELCIEQARLQSEITHTHVEGMAGAIAVAVATALVWQHRDKPLSAHDFLRAVSESVPASETKEGIEAAIRLAPDCLVSQAAEQLGNGSKIASQDTVPFCMWVVSKYLQESYEEAFWTTVSALGDRDTTCAIVGGILGVCHEAPIRWSESCEPIQP